MTKNGVLALVIAPLFGCTVGHSVGVDAAINGRVGGYVESEIRALPMDDGARVGLTTRVRAGYPFVDGGVGLKYCRELPGVHSYLCGTVYPIEIGSFKQDLTVGVFSPALHWEPTLIWGPIRDEQFRSRSNLRLRIGIGLDVRPLNDWNGTAPYLSLGIGNSM